MMQENQPDWWRQNASLKEALGLPPYEPSRFTDGTYTHEVISDLEETFECTIRFKGINPRYPDNWTVYIDGEPAFAIGRHRDENGNTVYEMASSEFRAKAERILTQPSLLLGVNCSG